MEIKSIFILVLSFVLGVIFMECEKKDRNFNRVFIELEEEMKNLNDNDKRQLKVNELIQQIKKTKYPIFENDSTVVLLYQGNEKNVGIIGDMNYWADVFPMKNISGTDLWYRRFNFEPNARLEYLIVVEGKDLPVLDQFNPYKVLSGFGPNSELAMPEYVYHPVFSEYLYGKKGSYDFVKDYEVPAGVLPYRHTIHIYIPPDYDEGKEYPSVYFQDGRDYIEFAIATEILNYLISTSKIQPIIAVFVTPPNRFKPDEPNRMTEYGLNDDYVKFFSDELVPFVESRYSIAKDPKKRLVVGDSFGGLISVYIPFKRPDVFGLGYGQSGYYSFQKDRLIKYVERESKKDVHFWIDVGTFEKKVGASFLPKEEYNFLEANRRLQAIFKKKGYDFVYKEYPEGHTWGNWRRHLIDALVHFFGER